LQHNLQEPYIFSDFVRELETLYFVALTQGGSDYSAK